MPVIRLNTVVLPAPFGPMSPCSVPAGSDRFRSWTARSPPKRMPAPRSSSSMAALPREQVGDLAAAEQAGGPQDHHPDEQARVDDHAVVGDGAEDLREGGEHDAGEQRPGERSCPAE